MILGWGGSQDKSPRTLGLAAAFPPRAVLPKAGAQEGRGVIPHGVPPSMQSQPFISWLKGKGRLFEDDLPTLCPQ